MNQLLEQKELAYLVASYLAHHCKVDAEALQALAQTCHGWKLYEAELWRQECHSSSRELLKKSLLWRDVTTHQPRLVAWQCVQRQGAIKYGWTAIARSKVAGELVQLTFVYPQHTTSYMTTPSFVEHMFDSQFCDVTAPYASPFPTTKSTNRSFTTSLTIARQLHVEFPERDCDPLIILRPEPLPPVQFLPCAPWTSVLWERQRQDHFTNHPERYEQWQMWNEIEARLQRRPKLDKSLSSRLPFDHRAQLVDWIQEIADVFEGTIRKGSHHLAIAYLDDCCTATIDSLTCQTTAAACLYLASPSASLLRDLCMACDNHISVEQIRACARATVWPQLTEGCMVRPTLWDYLHLYGATLNLTTEQRRFRMMMYLGELLHLSGCRWLHTDHPTSRVAVCVTAHALGCFESGDNQVLTHFVDWSDDRVQECLRWTSRHLSDVRTSTSNFVVHQLYPELRRIAIPLFE